MQCVVGGAIAGLLCKLDRNRGPWQDLDQRGYGLSQDLVPVIAVSTGDAHLLVKEGINVIAGRTAGRAMICGSVTLARGGQLDRNFSSLTVRRLCLEIIRTIDHATHWTAFATSSTAVAEHIESVVLAYMSSLAEAGALTDDPVVVQCDAGLHSSPVDKDRGITLLLTFHPASSEQSVSLTLHQTVAGCRVATAAFAATSLPRPGSE